MNHKNILFVLAFQVLCLSLSAQTVYVSPQGNDNAKGDAANPVATVQAAQIKARAIREVNPDADITIQLAEGAYYVSRPLHFTFLDSGTEKHPLVIKGAGMGKTEINGGIQLPSFQKVSDKLWCIDMSKVMPSGGEIQQFYVGGRRAVRARTPNADHYFQGGTAVETAVQGTDNARSGQQTMYGIQFKVSPEAMDALKNVKTPCTQLKISVFHAWDLSQRNVWSVSPADTSVYFMSTVLKPWNRIDHCAQYMFEDDIAFLDYPGEYFYDQSLRMLMYVPREDDTIDMVPVIPSTESVLTFGGLKGNHVKYINVEDLTIACSRQTVSWRGKEPQQAAFQTLATVMVDFATGINFNNCEISNTGNNGIWFRTACFDCSLKHSYIHDLGIGAVKIGDYVKPEQSMEKFLLTRNIVVENNILRSGGHVDATGVGVTLFHASDCKIDHNEVADFYYTGISVGWIWGYAHSPSKRNSVCHNHIHHIGWGLLSDMGGVYTLGASEGTVVNHNVIHDIYSLEYGGWGLYPDEGSYDIHMEYNLVYNCKSSGFHQHYGKENVIRNNIFVNSIRAQLEATRLEEHQSFDFSNNILVYSQGDMYGKNWDKVDFKCEKNIYWNTAGAVDWNGLSLKEWQSQTGKDNGSLIVDPKFRNPAANDYTPTNKKALRKIGFEVFNWDDVGVYGDTEWKKLAEFDPARAELFTKTVEWMEREIHK